MTTTRELAEKIVDDNLAMERRAESGQLYVTFVRDNLINTIDLTLKARDEWAAKIAESFYSGYGSTVPIKIADTIRKGL